MFLYKVSTHTNIQYMCTALLTQTLVLPSPATSLGRVTDDLTVVFRAAAASVTSPKPLHLLEDKSHGQRLSANDRKDIITDCIRFGAAATCCFWRTAKCA